jgi:hypothetical protein
MVFHARFSGRYRLNCLYSQAFNKEIFDRTIFDDAVRY